MRHRRRTLLVGFVLLMLALIVGWWWTRDVTAPPAPPSSTPTERAPTPQPARDRGPARTQEVPPPAAERRETRADPVALDDARTGTLVVLVRDAASGSAIVNARVEAVGQGTVHTDADGAARFDALPLRAMRELPVFVHAAADGFVSSRQALARVGEDEEAALTIELTRGTGARGRVVEVGTLAPVANARVQLYRGAGSGAFGSPLGETRTDVGGWYQAADLPVTGRVTLRVSGAGHASVTQAVEVPKDGADLPTIELAVSTSCRGRVLLPDGSPAPKAQVYFVPADRPELFDDAERGARFMGSGPPWRIATADQRGRFEMDQLLADAAYVVIASLHGYSSSARTEPLRAAGMESELTLHLRDPGSLLLRVDAGEEPVPAGTKVHFGKRSVNTGEWGKLSDSTWRATGLPPVENTVYVGAPGFLDVEQTVLPRPGEEVEITVVLDRGVSITGSVVDDLGAPLPGMAVVARSRDGRGKAITDSTGAFEIRGLARRSYKVRADGEQHEGDAVTAEAPATGVALVARRAGRVELVVKTPDGSQPRANVLFQRFTGKGEPDPLTGRKGWTRRIGGVKWKDGAAHIEWRTLGPARLRVHVAEHAPVHRAFELGPAEHVDLGTVTLSPGRTVRGRVQDEDGRALVGARIRVAECAVSNAQQGQTDRDGAFELVHVGDGPLTIEARAEGHGGADHKVQIDATTGTVVVQLTRFRVVSGIVLRGGDPVAQVHLQCVRVTEQGDAENHGGPPTDAEGRFRFELLPARYRVWADGAAPVDVDLTRQASADIELLLR